MLETNISVNTIMNAKITEKFRWYPYRLEWRVGSYHALVNLLNKASILIREDIFSTIHYEKQYRPFRDDTLNSFLREQNFIIPERISDDELLSCWSDQWNLLIEPTVVHFLIVKPL